MSLYHVYTVPIFTGGPPLSYILTPTIPIPQYMPPCAGKQFFWTVWNAKFHIGRQAFANLRAPRAWDQILHFVQRCIPELPYAPFPHIRKLLRMVDCWAFNELNYLGQWLCASFSPFLTSIYYGQTGAISQPRAVFTRWKEEMQQSFAWKTLQKSPYHCGPSYFKVLHIMGHASGLPLPI